MNNTIIKKTNDFEVLIENEICVCCGKDTGVSKYSHTDIRDFYVEGAGQLCQKCFVRIYGD